MEITFSVDRYFPSGRYVTHTETFNSAASAIAYLAGYIDSESEYRNMRINYSGV